MSARDELACRIRWASKDSTTAEQAAAMSRPQDAAVSAPESPASVRTGTRSNPGALGAQGGVGLTGKCKLCGEPMELLPAGYWIHEGLGYATHSAMLDDQRKAVAREAYSSLHSR